MTVPPVVVIAPDSFKGSLSAPRVADAVRAGFLDVVPDAVVRLRPIADGGEGTVDAVARTGARRHTVTVTGPLGAPVDADYAVLTDAVMTDAVPGDVVPGDVAVVEAAQAVGLPLVDPGPRSARRSTTYGVGELVAHALSNGVREVVLAVGGTASTDGGSGLASALGIRLLDRRGDPIGPGGEGLTALYRIDSTGRDRRLDTVTVTVACDVDNPLTGPRGAAAVFAPQKGAGADDVDLLERALAHFAAIVARETGHDVAALPGAGAAGGLAAGAVAFLGARVTSGAERFLALLDLPAALDGADLLVTGEGSLDRQSLSGKGPVALARAAAARGVTVYAVSGRTGLTAAELGSAGIGRAWSLTDVEADPAVCRRDAARLLRVQARAAATAWLATR